jgi:two-component system response regulator HydG
MSKNTIQDYIKKFNDLESVFDSMPTGVFAILDADLKIGTLNKMAEKILGISPERILGKRFEQVFESRFPGLKNVIDETIRYRRPVKNFTLEIESAGEPQTFLLSTALIEGAQDDELGVVLVLHDVTETTRLRKAFIASKRFGPMIGTSDVIKKVFALIETVAQYDTSVLICGETGTGKELVARAIHQFSPRADGPFIPVACSALSSMLLESELFGHEKGAFTGAYRERRGRFELAEGGTLFLDEVGTLSLDVQVKLMRTLQERTIERVGSSVTRPVDVRIISATNRNLATLIERGDFREDLFYRLKVLQIDVPPLRERKVDIAVLTDHFIEKFNTLYNRNILGASSQAKEALMRYIWPGNVRELENAVEHALVLTPGKIIEREYLPPEIRHMEANGTPPPPTMVDLNSEEENIRRVLEAYDYNITKAAKSLDMHRTTLWRKMKEFGIEKS